MACAAAIATLQLYQQEGLFERAARMGPLLGDAVHSRLRGLPHVVGIRSLGLAAAVELAPGPVAGRRAYEVFMRCFQTGLLVRPAGDNIVLCPPFIIEPAQIERMVDLLADAISQQA